MNYNESELFIPIKTMLIKMGYQVAAEVPIPGWNANCDLAAENNGITIAVEMKMSLTKHVIQQAYRNKMNANCAYAAISTTPKNLDVAQKHGIGIISVKNGISKIILKAEENDLSSRWYKHYAERFKNDIIRLSKLNNIGGYPQMKGEGPRIECQKRVDIYLKDNPNSTWREIYKNVPSHYCNSHSMAGAINK